MASCPASGDFKLFLLLNFKAPRRQDGCPATKGVLSKCLLLLVTIVHFVEDAVDDLLAGLGLGLLSVVDTFTLLC